QVWVGVDDSRNELPEVDRAQRRFFKRGGAGVAQGVLNESIEPTGGENNASGIILKFRRELRVAGNFLENKFGERAHGPQRSAHVVDDGVGNMLKFVDGLLKFGRALVDEVFQLNGVIAKLFMRFPQLGFALSTLKIIRGLTRQQVQKAQFPRVGMVWT